MKKLLYTIFAIPLLATPALSGDLFELGKKMGRDLCSSYNKNASYSDRRSLIYSVFASNVFADGTYTNMIMSGESFTDRQSEVMGAGMVEEISKTCPSKLYDVATDMQTL